MQRRCSTFKFDSLTCPSFVVPPSLWKALCQVWKNWRWQVGLGKKYLIYICQRMLSLKERPYILTIWNSFIYITGYLGSNFFEIDAVLTEEELNNGKKFTDRRTNERLPYNLPSEKSLWAKKWKLNKLQKHVRISWLDNGY